LKSTIKAKTDDSLYPIREPFATVISMNSVTIRIISNAQGSQFCKLWERWFIGNLTPNYCLDMNLPAKTSKFFFFFVWISDMNI